jgi:hypothetical protein
MASLVERAPSRTAGQRIAAALEVWNRKLHFYLGLYLLFFIWLFCFTGLLLNHPKWSFADFWPTRKQDTYTSPIRRPAAAGDLAQAKDVLAQLGLAGEIEWTTARADADRLDFRAGHPGTMYEIRADFARGAASVQRIRVNAWGVIRILHTFTGVRLGDTRNTRDWALTNVWAAAMDAVAIGLIVMVLGSYYMWWRLRRKRTWGTVALAAGALACGLFLIGLRMLV